MSEYELNQVIKNDKGQILARIHAMDGNYIYIHPEGPKFRLGLWTHEFKEHKSLKEEIRYFDSVGME